MEPHTATGQLTVFHVLILASAVAGGVAGAKVLAATMGAQGWWLLAAWGGGFILGTLIGFVISAALVAAIVWVLWLVVTLLGK